MEHGDLRSLWTLEAKHGLKDYTWEQRQGFISSLASAPASDRVSYLTWLIRLLGQLEPVPGDVMSRLVTYASTEPAPEISRELAATAIRLSSHYDTTALIHALMTHKEDATDPVIPLMLWLAYEPKLAAKPQAELQWLRANAAGNPLITDHIVPRAMRRLVATGKADDLNACVAFAAATDSTVRLRALEGLAEALKGRQVDLPAGWADARSKLLADSDERVKKLAAILAVAFRDLAAVRRALAVAADAKQSPAIRAEAIRTLAQPSCPRRSLFS